MADVTEVGSSGEEADVEDDVQECDGDYKFSFYCIALYNFLQSHGQQIAV